MCLDKVDTEPIIPDRDFGYKYFSEIYATNTKTGYHSFDIPRGKWVEDVQDYYLFPGYTCGFHIYLKRQDAARTKNLYMDVEPYSGVLRVKFRNVVATGVNCIEDDKGPTIVAREIFVPKPVRKKVTKNVPRSR